MIKSECGVVRDVIHAPQDSKEMREGVAGYNEVMQFCLTPNTQTSAAAAALSDK
jgi:hypothetical protein